ncbi:MAG: hypothetical protein NZ959_02300 [Armatimonadetes bacterium]|nr:hypothetical protein [Armatimonadota bacterium]MDW8120994.1 hypothetical protein [Armatimonadota bacterium]
MRRVWMFLIFLFFLAGCETGRRQHTVVTGTTGSLEGLQTIPPDHSLDVETDRDPEIFWARGTPPPQFTAALRRIDEFSQVYSVPTELVRIGPETSYHWKLKVTGTLWEGTLYSIVVTSSTERKEAWFLTEKSWTLRSPKPRQTEELSEKQGKSEHLIRLAPEP